MKHLKLYRIGIVAWALSFFFLATGIHDWRLWITLSIAVVERLLTECILFYFAHVINTLGKYVEELKKHGV